MDWLDYYLNGLDEYKTTVSPADTHIWGPAKPSKQQQSMIQDAVAFDQQQQMRMIQEARRQLEEHGPSSLNQEGDVNRTQAADAFILFMELP